MTPPRTIKQVACILISFCIFGTTEMSWAGTEFQIKQYSENVYRLTVDMERYTVSLAMSVGPDGVLLVDTGEVEWAEDLRAEILSIAGELPKMVINTHAHADHTGGNYLFGGDATLIAHARLGERLTMDYRIWGEEPPESFPDISFTSEMNVHFNGEDIRLIAIPGAHDDNDLIVWFKDSKVAVLGDLSYGMDFPTVDTLANAANYADVIAKIITILPDDTRIISGHGRDVSMSELVEFQAMLEATTEVVRKALAEGKDENTIVKEGLLDEWASFAEGYASTAMWVNALSTGIRQDPADALPTALGSLYYIFKGQDASATISEYIRLRETRTDEFFFGNSDLAFMGNKAVIMGRSDEGMLFYQAEADIYPEGRFAAYSYSKMAGLRHQAGDDDMALEYLNKALTKDPDFVEAQDLLEKISGKRVLNPPT